MGKQGKKIALDTNVYDLLVLTWILAWYRIVYSSTNQHVPKAKGGGKESIQEPTMYMPKASPPLVVPMRLHIFSM